MSNRLAFIFLAVHSKTVTAKEVFPQPTACVILEQTLGHVKVREETELCESGLLECWKGRA